MILTNVPKKMQYSIISCVKHTQALYDENDKMFMKEIKHVNKCTDIQYS